MPPPRKNASRAAKEHSVQPPPSPPAISVESTTPTPISKGAGNTPAMPIRAASYEESPEQQSIRQVQDRSAWSEIMKMLDDDHISNLKAATGPVSLFSDQYCDTAMHANP